MNILRALFLLLCASSMLYAQQPATVITKPARCRTCARRIIKSGPVSAAAPQQVPEFFIGEAKVDLVKDQTVVRLAMAQHGSVLIELPANDGPRYIIPGDPEMATVDQKALERNKRAIIVRPGTQFLPPAGNVKARTPAATVTAQMRSGLVVTFLFYPVEDLAQNVHRCVLSYNRDEVVARRRAAGLPVNLDIESRGEMTVQSVAPTTISVESTSDNEKKPPASPPPPQSSPRDTPKAPESIEEPEKDERPADTVQIDRQKESTTVASIREALQQAMKQPGQFKQWTRPSQGLKLSQTSVPILDQSYSVAIVAIRNTTTSALTLTATSPDLVVEIVNDEGRPVNIESLKYLHLEPSDPTRKIPSRGTTYYAVAYRPPVLGTHQRIKLSVAHSYAADEPVSIVLSRTGK
jgi:hypothetical protein